MVVQLASECIRRSSVAPRDIRTEVLTLNAAGGDVFRNRGWGYSGRNFEYCEDSEEDSEKDHRS